MCIRFSFIWTNQHIRLTDMWVQNQVSVVSKVNLYCHEGPDAAALMPSRLVIVPREEDSREIMEGYYVEMTAVTQVPVMSLLL